MKASEELTDEQSRQVHPLIFNPFLTVFFSIFYSTQLVFDVEHAYAEFFRSLGSDNNE